MFGKFLLITSIISVAFAIIAGYMAFRVATGEPEIVYEYVEFPPKIIEVEKTIYVDRVVEIPVYKTIVEEVIKEIVVVEEVYRSLSDWLSIEELDDFLRTDNINDIRILVANQDGIINLNGQCEDFAFQLRERAESIGKRLDTEILNIYDYQRWYGNRPNNITAYDGHYICKAVIGNEVWFVEPSDDSRWLAYYLD